MRTSNHRASSLAGRHLRSYATPWGAAPNPAFATGQPPAMIKPSPAAATSVRSLRPVKGLSRHKRAATYAAHLFHGPLDSSALHSAAMTSTTGTPSPFDTLLRYAVTTEHERDCLTKSIEVNMAKTTAQRQAAYRARRSHAGDDGNGERRLNLWIRTRTDLAIERLARRYCVTQREIIERLVIAEDDRVSSSIDLDSPEWDEYFGTVAVTQ